MYQAYTVPGWADIPGGSVVTSLGTGGPIPLDLTRETHARMSSVFGRPARA